MAQFVSREILKSSILTERSLTWLGARRSAFAAAGIRKISPSATGPIRGWGSNLRSKPVRCRLRRLSCLQHKGWAPAQPSVQRAAALYDASQGPLFRHRQIVHCRLFPGLEDSTHCPGLGDAPTRHKRRVGIINLPNRAETPCLDLVSHRRQE